MGCQFIAIANDSLYFSAHSLHNVMLISNNALSLGWLVDGNIVEHH